MTDEKTAADHDNTSPASETLEAEGFSDTEDALKDADVKGATGDADAAYGEQSSKKATSGATEHDPNVGGPETGGP